jgi:hypothetical protein
MLRRAGSGGGGAEELEIDEPEMDEEDEVGESVSRAEDVVPHVRGGGRGGGREDLTASSARSEGGCSFLAGSTSATGFGVNSSASSSSENGLCKLTR